MWIPFTKLLWLLILFLLSVVLYYLVLEFFIQNLVNKTYIRSKDSVQVHHFDISFLFLPFVAVKISGSFLYDPCNN